MALSQANLARRGRYIGASEMAAVMGLNPWQSGWDVWARKTGLVPETEANEAMQLGTELEPSVLNWAATQLGPLIRNQWRVYTPMPILSSTLDAIVAADATPVEAKTAGILRGFASEEWGEPGTDEIPLHIIIQTHVQMMTGEADHCHVPALLAGRGFLLFAVERNKGLCEMIAQAAEKFWHNNVEKVIPPLNCSPSMETIKRINRIPDTVVDIHDQIVEQWMIAKEAEKQAADNLEEKKAALLAQLGTAEAGRSSLGTITYLEQKRAGYTVAETTFRTLRLQKPKKETK